MPKDNKVDVVCPLFPVRVALYPLKHPSKFCNIVLNLVRFHAAYFIVGKKMDFFPLVLLVHKKFCVFLHLSSI